MNKRVLSVGNCTPDHRAVSALIEHHFSAQVLPADSLLDALQQLQCEPFDLVLVNRQLDRDGSDGLEVIRQIKADPNLSNTPVMMVTNFSEYQQSAQLAGAVEGFGKRSLQAPETLAKLKPFLGD